MYRNDINVIAQLESGVTGPVKFSQLKVFRPLQAALGCLGVTISGDERAGEVYQAKTGKLGFAGPFIGAKDGAAYIVMGEVTLPLAGLLGTGVEKSANGSKVVIDSQLVPDPEKGSLVLSLAMTVSNSNGKEVDLEEDIFCSLPTLGEGEARVLPKIRDMVKAIDTGTVDFLSWPSSGGTKLADLPEGDYFITELGDRTPSKLYPGKFDQRCTLAAKVGGQSYSVFLPDRTQRFLQGYDAVIGESLVTVGAPLTYTDREGKERKQANITVMVDTFTMKQGDLEW